MLEKIKRKDTETSWVKFAEVPELHAVGKDAVAMHTSCHVVLYDAGRGSTAIYHASGGGKGDGVRCLAGHPTLALFAFAEMCLRPRIMVFSYPSLSLVSTLTGEGCSWARVCEGKSGGGYLSLALMETDLAVSLSAYPKFAVAVWSWRKGERLVWQESGLVNLEQSLRCGLGWPTTVCQAAGPGPLLLWEVGVSGKLCGLTRRAVALPGQARHCGLAWSPEELLVVDVAGNVYSVGRDGREALLSLQWSGEDAGATPAVAWFKGGLVLSGPDTSLQLLKRTADGWTQLWAVKPAEPLVRLGSLAQRDVLLCLSDRALLYQLQTETEHGSELLAVQQYGCSFVLSCMLLPTGEHCLAVSRDGLLTVWETGSGAAVAAVHLNHQYLAISPNPIVPYVVLSRPDGALDFISMHNPAEPQVMDQVWLCSERLDDVQFATSGRLMVAAAKKKGWLFLLEGHVGQRAEVLSRVEAARPVTDYALLDGGKAAVLLLVLLASRPCCGAGREVAVYRKSAESRTFDPRGVAHLCGDYVRLCAVPSGDLSVCAVPHGSKQLHLLRLLDDGSADAVPLFVPFCLKDAPVPRTAPVPDPVLRLDDAGLSCHQLRRFGLSAGQARLLSYGADGLAGLYELPSLEGRGVFATHHRHAGGVAAAAADPAGERLVCLGADGSLVGVTTNIGEDNSVETPQDAVSAVQVYVPPVQTLPLDTGDPSERRTWLQTQQDIQQMQEAMAVSAEKKKIMDDFLSLQEQLDSLLEANEMSPPERQLPVAEFDLDQEGRARRLREAERERERVRDDALALCRARDELCQALRKKYWQPMEVKGRVVQSFTSPFVVENYPVMRASGEFEEALKRVVSSRRLELAVNKDFLCAWLPHQPSSPEPEPAREQLEARRGTVGLQRALLEAEEEEEEEGAAACGEACGSVSHRYVEVPPLRHHQYELVTCLQWYHEAVLLQDVIERLRQHFNQQFDRVLEEKKAALEHLGVVCGRLREIAPELDRKYLPNHSLRLTPLEDPDSIMTVAASEVGALPYVSPGRQALVDRLAAEAEARRLAELADNFRELALDRMMGGVLEVRWEDEIKKDIPKPKCMAERQPEEYTEQDLRDVKEYEERVRQLMVERERYRKMLEQEFGRLVTEEQNLMAEFDKKLDGLYQLKLNIEGAVKQEQLKILRARLLSHRRAQLDAREKHLLEEEARREQTVEEMRSELQRLEQALEELRATYDASLARDKQLEKSFRKNVPPDLPVLTVDQLSKAYRRHPKMHQRLQASAWMLGELSHLCLTTGRPVSLPPEAEDFLRGLDAQDAFSNAPPNVSEDAWQGFMHGRRLKVESELRVKSLGLEVAESEATVASAQRRLAAAKEEISVLRAQLAAVRADKLHIVHNAQIQLVLEQGNVEVPITGKISDFDDAVLIDRSTVENINEIIKEKGKEKLAVMRESANVRRVILHKEWQHRELSMQAEDLSDHIHSLEAVQITREIQKYLLGKRMGLPEEKGVSLEKEIQLARKFYEKAGSDVRGQLSQLDQKTQLVRRQNAELDRKVAAVNVDVSERHLRRDPGLEASEAEAVQRRMSTIVKRSQLVRRIQRQHNEIMVLRTELELLRLRTYPTLRYKSSF